MGLDWIVRNKRKDDGVDLTILSNKIEEQREEIDSCYKMYCESLGTAPPNYYPNALHQAFFALDSTKEMRAVLDQLEEQYESHFITPEDTIGVPKAGIDKKANEWILANWEDLDTLDDDGKDLSFEEFIALNFGRPVYPASDSPGIAEIGGMFVTPTSFRGKVVGNSFLLSQDLQNRAYEDMTPAELAEYGEELSVEIENFIQENKQHSEDHKREIKDLKSAVKWCSFWAKNGHGIHAWY